MSAASQLPVRGPTVVDIAPYLHINRKSYDDEDDDDDETIQWYNFDPIFKKICLIVWQPFFYNKAI